MKRILAISTVVVLTAGCGDATKNPVAIQPVPGPTFTLSGIVRDEDGNAMWGATVTVTDPYSTRQWTATTNQAGYFQFTGIAGQLTVRVTAEDYYEAYSSLRLDTDLTISFHLSRTESLEIQLGVVLHTRVPGRALPCDPSGWDAIAPCRRFRFTAPQTGLLSIDITWNGQLDLDAVVMSPRGEYLQFSSGIRSHIHLSVYVEKAQTYEIRVHSYYSEQEFDLKAELLPDG
jgi:hypothetical protein